MDISKSLRLARDLIAQGEYERAAALCKSVIKESGASSEAYYLLGLVFSKTSRLEEAIAALSKAIVEVDIDADIFHRRACCFFQLGSLNEALADFTRAICIDSSNARYYNDRGVALKRVKRLSQALQDFIQATVLDPCFAIAFYNLGNAYRELGRLEQAIHSFDRSIQLDPSHTESHHNRALALEDCHRFDEALAAYDNVLKIKSTHRDALINSGVILARSQLYEEARQRFNSVCSNYPDFAPALNNLGNLMRSMGNDRASLAYFSEAIRVNSRYVEAMNNRGNALASLGRFAEAHRDYDEAIRCSPSYSEAHWNKGLTLLLQGNFRDGWPLYEWRWKRVGHVTTLKPRNAQLWLGQAPLSGRSLLVQSEQGFGDTIQFSRFVRQLRELGAKVVMQVPDALLSLLKRSIPADSVIGMKSEPLDIDFFCPMMSLPLALEISLETIPTEVPYITADSDRVNYWSSRLGPSVKPRIGLVWQGGHRPKQPELWITNQRRNIPLERLVKALGNLPVDFFSLQKQEKGQSAYITADPFDSFGENFYDFSSELTDFDDTAALIHQLDLVISVDTAVAHLAAAMGKPTWILNRFDTCWRWLLERSDSPWYPTVRLFRQGADRDWSVVLQRVGTALNQFADQRSQQSRAKVRVMSSCEGRTQQVNDDLIASAIDLHRRGDLEGAQRLYEEVLEGGRHA